jgi:pimeloyl-ACP methyl ester carboxylesterase
MISIALVTALVTLALGTQAGVLVVQRTYPAKGMTVGVLGAKINIVDIGPRDLEQPPIIMIHGASSNLEVMRQPLGDLLARKHRVILVDRPGHGWSSRESEEDSTPEVQARMIAEAMEKLGIGRAILLVHSWSGALGARMALDRVRAAKRAPVGRGLVQGSSRPGRCRQEEHANADRPRRATPAHRLPF